MLLNVGFKGVITSLLAQRHSADNKSWSEAHRSQERAEQVASSSHRMCSILRPHENLVEAALLLRVKASCLSCGGKSLASLPFVEMGEPEE